MFVNLVSLNQPPNVYPILVGFTKVSFVPYVLIKLGLAVIGSVPPLVLYLIV